MITLSAEQCRIIGVMLEKETTTPEQYPLSINGITTACNQKSNREPVMSLSEAQVQNSVNELVKMNLLMIDHKASGRVNKYFHRFCDTEFGDLKFTAQQRAIICLLLLRGPQTPGELRTRSNRLADFSDVNEVENALNQLRNLNNQTLVKKLEREPGKRESRYVQLFSGFDENHQTVQNSSALIDDAGHEVGNTNITTSSESEQILTQRINSLEQQVATLTEQVACLTELLDDK
tara:strand:+ start:9673 stop:10374 length:702 start_codon:yes stop_codon:yes gene_type:complete